MALKTCLVINPKAGQKAGVTTNPFTPADAEELLTRHGIQADVLCTERPSHATVLAKQAVADGYERIIAAGGDGTVAEVAPSLANTAATLGVLPLGSVMNVARMLGIPRDLEGAAAVIQAGQIARIDVGWARATAKEAFFLEAAGVGIDAGLFAYVNQIDKGNWRSLRPLFNFVWRYRPRRLRIRLDNRELRVRAMMITVANGPYLGAGLTLAPDAKVDDHRFDVRVFRRFSKFELIRYAFLIANGRHAYNPKVRTYQARRVEITGNRALMVHADSNPLGTTPARFELLPGALRVYVGAGSVSPLDPALSKPTEIAGVTGS